jgi:hypothetical protein
MTYMFRFYIVLFVMVFVNLSSSLSAQEIPKLSKLPLGERWFSISKNKEQAGYNRLEIRESGAGYEISVESGAKFSVLGFSREAISWERYQVNRDLSLKSFEVDEVINGRPMKLNGEVTPDGVRVSITSEGETKEKTLKAKGPIYPPPVMNIYPLMNGGEAGKSFRVKMLDIEKVKVIGVKITVIGVDVSQAGFKTVHMQNDLYTFVDNDIWVDLNGSTVKEAVSRANIITLADEGDSVKKFLATRPWLKRR